MDLVIVFTVLVLDTFLRPVLFAPLSVFAILHSLVLYTLTTYHATTLLRPAFTFFFLLPARNIDDPFASKEKRKWDQARMKEVKGDDLWLTEITVRPIALGGFTNSRQQRIYKLYRKEESL